MVHVNYSLEKLVLASDSNIFSSYCYFKPKNIYTSITNISYQEIANIVHLAKAKTDQNNNYLTSISFTKSDYDIEKITKKEIFSDLFESCNPTTLDFDFKLTIEYLINNFFDFINIEKPFDMSTILQSRIEYFKLDLGTPYNIPGYYIYIDLLESDYYILIRKNIGYYYIGIHMVNKNTMINISNPISENYYFIDSNSYLDKNSKPFEWKKIQQKDCYKNFINNLYTIINRDQKIKNLEKIL